MKKIILISLIIFSLASCISSKRIEQTIIGCEYNTKKDQTEYMVFPYGNVNIPGKWERTKHNNSARQQFFKNSDSITISIALGLSNKFEFNADGSIKDYDFVKTFYEWETEYFAKNFNLSATEIETNKENNYIIWRLLGTYNNSEWDTYFLSFEQKGVFKNFSIMTTDKWTTKQKIDFLKSLIAVE